ncbi:hypothetical protein [Micromonospora sp. NPDC047074]|uniref:hypothetical protein n=1 Tax=Micromonospora sp. NPDC047074 TaxID=3154339 RepID=UPI003400B4E4
MGMITDYFVATDERAEALAGCGPAGEELPKLALKWVEPAVLGSRLWAIIEEAPVAEGQSPPADRSRFRAADRLVALAEDQTSGVERIADGFVRALSALPDERIPAVAARWATAEEWVGPWAPGDLDSTVLALRDLARQVRLPDQHLYVWWCV